LEFDSGREKGRLLGLANANIGQKSQNALELSHRDGKHPSGPDINMLLGSMNIPCR
jgi:hypothetical protein